MDPGLSPIFAAIIGVFGVLLQPLVADQLSRRRSQTSSGTTNNPLRPVNTDIFSYAFSFAFISDLFLVVACGACGEIISFYFYNFPVSDSVPKFFVGSILLLIGFLIVSFSMRGQESPFWNVIFVAVIYCILGVTAFRGILLSVEPSPNEELFSLVFILAVAALGFGASLLARKPSS